MEIRNIRVVLSYDGTDFCGWQSQSSGRTAQDAVENALAELHGHPISVRVAGRTDAGVHASGQVVNFKTESNIPSDRFVPAMNQHLPPDIRALRSDEVDFRFDSRFDAKIRVYKYFIENGRSQRPATSRFAWSIPRRLDTALLNSYAARIVGKHDFSTFAAAGDTSVSKTRQVFGASFFVEGSRLVFKIAANAFLYRMVRSLVGTMVELGRLGAAAQEMGARLSAKERSACGQTAPAWGLFLHKVVYDERHQF
ncbi:MAG TPA: tRNA pseudouridine(38-40) synthase TruA [Spirochaetia bacterium]|nr:tRNA pseudouridine(38-40) synthase TruA [Spirochaetia bacterium]